jgi:hypothetical protein
MIAVVYLSAAPFVPDPGDFVDCCVIGYLAAVTARNSWEDTE